jgi:hypothetical protein
MVDSESWGKIGVKTGVDIIYGGEQDAAVQFAALKADVCILVVGPWSLVIAVP